MHMHSGAQFLMYAPPQAPPPGHHRPSGVEGHQDVPRAGPRGSPQHVPGKPFPEHVIKHDQNKRILLLVVVSSVDTLWQSEAA